MCSQPAAACGERSKSLVLLLCDSCGSDESWRDDLGVVPLIGRDRARPSIPRHVHGQQDANGCSLSGLALGFCAAPMQLDNVFDDCQSKTGPAEFASAGFIGAVKAFEDTW